MIAIKKALYMTVPLLTAITSCVQANDNASSGSFTIGLGGRYAPRYSGSDKQVWQVVPVVQGRNGAFFIDSQKGVGYDLQNTSGWYFEHTLGYDLGRKDKNASWRAGANNLKGMGDIDVSLNTALAVGWQAFSWLSVEGKAAFNGQPGGKLPGILHVDSRTNWPGHVRLSNGGPVWRQALPEYLVWREFAAEPALSL